MVNVKGYNFGEDLGLWETTTSFVKQDGKREDDTGGVSSGLNGVGSVAKEMDPTFDMWSVLRPGTYQPNEKMWSRV